MSAVKKVINVRLLELYKRIYGDLRIPSAFTVPKNNQWPTFFHYSPLGNYANILRTQYKSDKSVFDDTELERTTEMGFVWNVKDPDVEKALFALKLYRQKFRDVDVPLTFKVPIDSHDWPPFLSGYKLGDALNSIRLHGFHKPIHNELRRLGFDLSPKKAVKDIDRICDSLQAYKRVHGHLKVPRHFVVPEYDAVFPAYTGGFDLGYAIYQIQHTGHHSEHHDRLRSIGLDMTNNTTHEEFDGIYAALELYKEEYGDLDIPQRYVVPHGDLKYPESSWGMKLGAIVRSIRKNNLFGVHKDKLLELGIVYKEPKKSKKM